MPTALRCLGCAACAALIVATAWAAEKELPKQSPFVASNATPPPKTAAPASNYELAAIITNPGKKTTVNIYDKAAKKGHWVAVGETSGEIKVVSLDAKREQVVVRIGSGPEKTLSLRATSAASSGAPATVNVPAAIAPPVANVPVMSEPPVNVAPTPVPTNQPPPPAPGTTAYQEQEARMLVSDLLEIGIAQRKAYEEAQKKAAEEAVARANQSSASAASPPPAKP